MLRHRDVRLHPRMLIAFHRHQHFRPRQLMLQWRSAVGLSLVPVGIVLRREVDIVLRRIAVSNRNRFVDDYAQDVRLIVTTILIERC
jgi:hypothetical protein